MGISIQFRRGTAANWTSANPILLAGEIGFETDTTKFKLGDGVTAWSSLSYVTAGDVPTSLYVANSILAANASNTPMALTIAEQTMLGRITGGNIAALSVGQIQTLLGLGSMAYAVTSDYVAKALFTAYTILMATTSGSPQALTVGEQTVVGRITGGAIAALTVAQLQALLLSAALTENLAIQLTAAPSADGKYSGITEAGTLGTTVTFGQLCYFNASDSKWYLAKADSATTSSGKIGICLVGGSANGATTILLYGKVRADAQFPTFTIGAPVYISAATAGALVTTAPSASGNEMRTVGFGNTAHELFFCPSPDWFEHA